MDGDVAVHPAREARRPAARDRHARNRERALLHSGERVRMAAVTQMLTAGFDRAALFLCLAQRRSVRWDQHGTGDEPARDRGP